MPCNYSCCFLCIFTPSNVIPALSVVLCLAENSGLWSLAQHHHDTIHVSADSDLWGERMESWTTMPSSWRPFFKSCHCTASRPDVWNLEGQTVTLILANDSIDLQQVGNDCRNTRCHRAANNHHMCQRTYFELNNMNFLCSENETRTQRHFNYHDSDKTLLSLQGKLLICLVLCVPKHIDNTCTEFLWPLFNHCSHQCLYHWQRRSSCNRKIQSVGTTASEKDSWREPKWRL